LYQQGNADNFLNIQTCRIVLLKSSPLNGSALSNRTFSPLLLIAPVLILTACSASNRLDPNGQSVNPSAASSSPAQAAIDQSLGATVDIALIGSEQSGTAVPDIPMTGAATPATNESAVEALPVDQTVACSAPVEHIQQRTLQLINQARAQPRSCGTESFEATTAVSWNTRLLQAAEKHSVDMTQHNFFDHTGSDGSSVAARVDETGYQWRAVGENIAAGQRSASEVVAGWLASPGHCRNLMNPVFAEVAVTCVEDNGADFTRYWTNVLATSL